jgi:hypothetical protein
VVVDKEMHKVFKEKTRGVPHSIADAALEIKARFDYYLKEHERVKADIEGLKNVADIVRGLSLPTELLVNECNAEVLPVDKSLRRRSKKLLKQPQIKA